MSAEREVAEAATVVAAAEAGAGEDASSQPPKAEAASDAQPSAASEGPAAPSPPPSMKSPLKSFTQTFCLFHIILSITIFCL